MLHVEADQVITRKMTTNLFTEPYALFHENDLGAFLLFCIECYMSEAYQTIPPILIRRLPVLIRMLLCKNLFHKALHCNSNTNANETVNSTTANRHGRARNQARIGASIAARPQPAPISNSLLAKEERSWVEVAESPTLNLRI